MKGFTIADILTDQEIEEARRMYRRLKDTGRFAAAICDKFIEPNMARINTKLGQENNSLFLAYAIEHILSQEVRHD
ncbi:hypothetical protein [Methanoregula sp.]|jgi:hypothetical protein|uniref:hypothetical protein n=1 Tax=Methanoregula sp. TaxID=2052170 RepID=UPI003568104D